MRNALLRMLGWFAALPYVFVFILVMTGPTTWSGILYVLALGAVVFGLATLPRLDDDGNPIKSKRRPRGVTRAGFALIAVVAFIRCFTASSGETMTMPHAHGGSARFAGRLVDEGDVAISGTRVLVGSGILRDDAAALPSAMKSAYADMRKEEGDLPTPFVGTYLGLQRAHEFDVVLVEPPPDAPKGDGAVIFLHGYAGNFDLPCWQVARASRVLTACPSTNWTGSWWTSEGQATLEQTIDILHARGAKRIVLAGLSNGGYGASRLAPRIRGKIAALVLISGADPDAGSPGVPTLVIHGVGDNMAPVSEGRAYAAKYGARFVGLNAGHFAMLVKKEESDRALRAFVEQQTRGPRLTAHVR